MNLRETSTIASPCCAPLLHTSLPAESTSWTGANNLEQTMDALNARMVDLLPLTLQPFLRDSSTSVPFNALNSPTQSLASSTRFPLKTCPTRTLASMNLRIE
jgi:hypothetical protein